MQQCEWGYTDCKNLGEKCFLCVSRGFHYEPIQAKKPKPMARRQQRADKRMGSSFEYKNHVSNEATINNAISSKMTPNSGAGSVKGDEQIRGLINVMEELKTKVKEQAPGKKTFTIKKEWLNKLRREALDAGMEFWYLKFSFNEHDDDIYIIVEEDVIMSMVATMVHDRKAVNEAKQLQDIAEKERRLKETEIVKLEAEIDLLKAKLDYYESKEKEGAEDL